MRPNAARLFSLRTFFRRAGSGWRKPARRPFRPMSRRARTGRAAC